VTALLQRGRRRAAAAGRSGALLVAIGAVVIALWTGGLIAFARSIPETLVDHATPTDAIIVLTGGSMRLATGLDLVSNGLAGRVLISGVHRDVAIDQLLRKNPGSGQDLRCCVDAGHVALDTAGNAAESALWMQHHGFRSLRLVTGSYHMPRSLLEFRHAMPDATVIPHPVFPEDVKIQNWWQWPGTAALIVGEYNKFLLSWIRQTSSVVRGERGS
jgi:uncharacterized SAM-binding protein YcdF (DUF218 family)